MQLLGDIYCLYFVLFIQICAIVCVCVCVCVWVLVCMSCSQCISYCVLLWNDCYIIKEFGLPLQKESGIDWWKWVLIGVAVHTATRCQGTSGGSRDLILGGPTAIKNVN